MIADVITKNGYYQVLNERGQKIAEKSESALGELQGFTDRFLLFHKGDYFVTTMSLLEKSVRSTRIMLVFSKG